jgi:hydrophobic/amphiphilic exporter-1 (mainly G- bacteria), HAE1 family
MKIVDIAIKRPVFIVMIILAIITIGIVGYSRLPVNLLPSMDIPTLMVSAVYSGASSAEMESRVTKILEDSLSTVEGLDTLSSTTKEGVSSITVEFKDGTDLRFAELKVRQKIDAVKSELPDDMDDPVIRKFSTDDMPVAVISLNGNRSQTELTEMVNNEIKTPLEATPGVGGITLFSGSDKIVKVTIDKSLLNATGLTYTDISTAISANNISYPVGTISGTNKDITVRVYGKASSIDELGDITIKSKAGKIIRIKDVAKIGYGAEDETSKSRVNGKSSVLFAVFKQSGENTVKVVDELKITINKLQKQLGSNIKLNIVMETGTDIKKSIDGVQSDILVGALLAIIIVWLFLGNFRSTIITAMALPNSLLGAFFLVYVAGFSLNLMTLLSLSLAVGLLIDDSIVVRENIFRHIELGENPKIAAQNGTNEVGMAVLSTTLAILAVFVPISFLQGTVGQMFKQFGLTIAFALLISLLDAFTSAPMLSAYWYKKSNKDPKGLSKIFANFSIGWNKVYNDILKGYNRVLKWSLNHKLIVIASVLALFILTIFLTRFVGMNFMSNNGNSYTISLETYPGAPLNKMDEIVTDIEKFVAKQDDVTSYYSRIGESSQKNKGSVNVTLKGVKERKKSVQESIAIIRNYIKNKFDKNLTFSISEQSMGGGGGSTPIVINIFGSDFNELEKISRKMSKILSETPGAADIGSTLKPGTPELVIKLDNLKAKKLGITASEVGSTLYNLLSGKTVSTYSVGDKDYDIVLRLDEKQRKNINELKDLVITTSTGEKLLLGSFCTLTYSSTPLEIRRQDNQRIVKVTANLAKGYSLNQVISNVQKNFDKKLILPAGYSYEFGGDQKNMKDMIQQIAMAILLALIFMYMILASLYDSFIQPFYLMLSIPLAVIGVFIALLMTGTNLDLYGFIGILLVCGLVAKNAILLIDFINKQRESGMSIRESIFYSGTLRLRPILMTSFAMIFGMLPLALGLNEGSSGRQGLPISVIGGIISSTILTLVVIPVVYESIEGFFEKRKIKKQQRLSLEGIKDTDIKIKGEGMEKLD